MLSLQPPFLESGNLMLFRDDVDNTTFYYACQQPRISKDENGEPMISAYSILPESGANLDEGAILEAGLNVEVDLAPTDEELDEARNAIQKNFGTEAKILSPVPLHKGKLRFLMAAQGEENDPKKWFITSDIVPSMMGSNKASLAVRTSGRDAKLLIAAANQGEVSACIYYDLELIGITPVYHARMVADMAHAYHYIREYKKDEFLFYSEEVDKIVQDLYDSKNITVEIEETDPDIKSEALKTMLSEFKSKMLEELFTSLPSIQPSQPNKGSIILQVLSAITILPRHYEFKSQLDESQLKTITIDLSQKNAKTYPFCPQALLRSLIDAAGVDMASRITWIKLDELPFFNQTVSVRIAPDTFSLSNINTIVVSCRILREDTLEQVMEPQTRSFSVKEGITAWDFNFNRQRGVDYIYEYKATMFMTSDSQRLPDKLEVDWRRAESSYIYINPAEYYQDFELDINLNDTSVLEHVQMVQVDVAVNGGDDDEAPLLQKTFIFSDTEREHRRMALVAGRDIDLRYSIKLTYFLPGAREHVVESKRIYDTFYFIPNPFENRWVVDLMCKADWEKSVKVYLDTVYNDAEREDPVTGHFIFSSEHKEDRLQAACSVDTPPRIFRYQISVVKEDGSIVRGGWYDHNDSPVLMIHADTQKPETVFRIVLGAPGQLDRLDLKTANVEFRSTSPDGTESITLWDVLADGPSMVFKAPRESECSVKFYLKNRDSESFRSKWQKVLTEEFTIDIPSDIW